MSRINTNVSSLIAQSSLNRSNADLQVALSRLSTGLRINTGKDDPAGLIASELLRRDITSIEKAISNSERANQLIATADSALGQVSSLLNDIRGLVTEAANSGALSSEQIAANQLQVDSSLEAIDRISQVTTFQGRRIFDGSLEFVTSITTGSAKVSDLGVDQATLGSSGLSIAINISAAATKATIATEIDNTASAAATATIDFTGAGTPNSSGVISVTVADSSGNGSQFNGLTIVVAEDASLATGVAVASFDATANSGAGEITVTVDDTGTTNNLTIASAIDNIDGVGGNDVVFTAAVTTAGSYDAADTGYTSAAAAGGADGAGIAAATVFQLTGSLGAEVFSFGANTTANQIRDAVNLVSGATGVEAVVTVAGSDEIVTFNSTDFGSESLVDVEVIDNGGSTLFEDGFGPTGQNTGTRDNGSDVAATVNGVVANGKGNRLSINTSTLDLNLTAVAGSTGAIDISISSGGAVFQLGPEVVTNQQARIGIGALNTGQLGGVNGRLFQLRSGSTLDLETDTEGAARVVDEVITKITSLRGRLGAFQRTTLESNIVSLTDTLSNLTEAESSIRDADFAAESARLTRAQILVQSGTTVLTIANQNPQNVLALLR